MENLKIPSPTEVHSHIKKREIKDQREKLQKLAEIVSDNLLYGNREIRLSESINGKISDETINQLIELINDAGWNVSVTQQFQFLSFTKYKWTFVLTPKS